MHVSTGREIAAVGQDHDGVRVIGVDQRPEPVPHLGIAVEREGVFSLGPVVRDTGDSVLDLATKVLWLR